LDALFISSFSAIHFICTDVFCQITRLRLNTALSSFFAWPLFPDPKLPKGTPSFRDYYDPANLWPKKSLKRLNAALGKANGWREAQFDPLEDDSG
jgi:hypothetical protein